VYYKNGDIMKHIKVNDDTHEKIMNSRSVDKMSAAAVIDYLFDRVEELECKT